MPDYPEYFYKTDYDDIANDPNGKFDYWVMLILFLLFMSGMAYLGYKFIL